MEMARTGKATIMAASIMASRLLGPPGGEPTQSIGGVEGANQRQQPPPCNTYLELAIRVDEDVVGFLREEEQSATTSDIAFERPKKMPNQ